MELADIHALPHNMVGADEVFVPGMEYIDLEVEPRPIKKIEQAIINVIIPYSSLGVAEYLDWTLQGPPGEWCSDFEELLTLPDRPELEILTQYPPVAEA